MSTNKRVLKCDVAVLGGGAAGLSVAAGAARLGQKVVLFEPGAMGGECLNSGCVPSKAIIAAADQAAGLRAAARMGVHADGVRIDFAAVMAHVRATIAAIEPHDSQERFEGLGVTVIREAARFTDARTLESDSVRVQARRIALATGSRPVTPPIPGLDTIEALTNETIWGLDALPDALAIVGAGAMGVELGQAFARLGTRVTLIERAPSVLPGAPSLLRDTALAALQADGVTVLLSSAVSKFAPAPEGASVTVANEAGASQAIAVSHVLLATGRRPHVEGLDLEAAGVAYDKRGVTVDAQLRTTNRRVYALGDVVDRERLTHAAGWHASVFVRNVLFRSGAKVESAPMPKVVYCDPELAWIGEDEASATERLGAGKVRVGKAVYSGNDRSIAEGTTTGAAHVVAHTNGRVLGAVIAGEGAGEALQMVGLALSSKLKMRDLASVIAPYPSRGEIIKRAAGDWYEPVLFGSGARTLVHLLSKLP